MQKSQTSQSVWKRPAHKVSPTPALSEHQAGNGPQLDANPPDTHHIPACDPAKCVRDNG